MISLQSRDDEPIDIRPYRPADAAETLAVFLAAITETASADYAPDQIAAWADPDGRDLAQWDTSMMGRRSFVATFDGDVAGFSDVGHDGYIDMMFVAPPFGRCGVATRLLAHGELLAHGSGAQELSANVSVTARPFFERHGFSVQQEQEIIRQGVRLTNFRMRKSLGA